MKVTELTRQIYQVKRLFSAQMLSMFAVYCKMSSKRLIKPVIGVVEALLFFSFFKLAKATNSLQGVLFFFFLCFPSLLLQSFYRLCAGLLRFCDHFQLSSPQALKMQRAVNSKLPGHVPDSVNLRFNNMLKPPGRGGPGRAEPGPGL